jgi:hypothetical protein
MRDLIPRLRDQGAKVLRILTRVGGFDGETRNRRICFAIDGVNLRGNGV